MRSKVLLFVLAGVWGSCTAARAADCLTRDGDDPVLGEAQLVIKRPAKANGTAIIVCPGGAYHFLSEAYEWSPIQSWLTANGVTVIELKYTVWNDTHDSKATAATTDQLHPKPLLQADRAVRRVRRYATRDASSGIDPDKIGVMGFSAGGHVASTIATHFQPGDATASLASEMHYSSRPDFQVLGYPLITMEADLDVGGHNDSRNAVLGTHRDDAELIRYLSNEYHVTAESPKAYISHGTGDNIVKIQKTLDYVAALRANGVPVTYRQTTENHGGYGWSMDDFKAACLTWLKADIFPACAHAAYNAPVYAWSGDTCTVSRSCAACGATISDAFTRSNQAAPTVTGDWYVSPEGSDKLFDGKTPFAPFGTIAHAVAVAAAGQTICVMSGVNQVDAAIVVDKNLTIVGATGNPADVIVRNTKVPTTSAPGPYRVFELNHAQAVVSGLAIEGGAVGALDKQGGNVLIDTQGGTVTNCIIRGARMIATGKTNANGGGIACLSADGMITHCIISNNYFTRGASIASSSQAGGAGAYLSGGTIRQSLIVGNIAENDNNGCAVSLGNSSLMENCTVAANTGTTGGNFSPVLLAYANHTPTIKNTLIYGNKDAAGANKLATANFVNCATDATNASSLSLIVVSRDDLTDDFRPKGSASAIVDKGAAMTSAVERDLAGNKRIYGDGVDIGCYEYKNVGPHDHVYDGARVQYAWASDYAACTATRVCTVCDEAPQTETVSAASPNRTEPTCTAAGSCTYTAVFTPRRISLD